MLQPLERDERVSARPVPSGVVRVPEGFAAHLRELAPVAEQERRIADSTVDALSRIGIFDLLVPRAHGGRQGTITELVTVARELAHGCSSTAWLAAFYGLHNYLASLFPSEVREQLFRDRSYVLAPALFAPNGRAKRVAGGHELTGRWPFGTGIAHADYVMLAGLTTTADGTIDVRIFLMPRSAVEVHDTWDTDGMRATASHDVSVKDLFVPEAWTLSFASFMHGRVEDAPFGDPLYGLPLIPLLALSAAAPALGTAEFVLDDFLARTRERRMAYGMGAKAKDLSSPKMHIGRARARLDAARLLLDVETARLDAIRETPRLYSIDERAHARLVAAHVVGESRRVIEQLTAASGASIRQRKCPIQRAQRDVNTLSGHVIFDEDATTELFGRVTLGQELPVGTMV